MKINLKSRITYRFKGASSVVGGFIMHLILGGFYLWASINLYFTSYYRIVSEPDLQTSKSMAVNTLIDLLGSLSMFTANFFISKLGIRGVAITFGLILSISVFLSSFMPNFLTFTLMFGVPFGVAFGILWILPIANIYQYFPKRKGLFAGIILCGIGVGTMISNYIALAVINPNNEMARPFNENEQYFDADIAMNFPFGFRILAIYFLFITIISTLLIFPHNKGEERSYNEVEFSETQISKRFLDEDEGESKITANETRKKDLKQGKEITKLPFTFTESMKTLFPYVLYTINTLSWTGCYIMSSNIKNYGILKINDDQFLTLVGSICGVFNGISRIGCGVLGDRFGYRKMWAVLMTMQTIFYISLPLISSHKWLYLIWTCTLFCCLGGQVPLLPAFIAEFYQPETASNVWAFVAMGFPSGNIIQYLIVLYTSSALGLGSMFYIAAAASLLSLIISLTMKLPTKD